MLLFFVLFVFFVLHAQFLLRNVLFGVSESTYYIFTSRYLFDQDVARRSLLFTVACAAAFALCYSLVRGRRRVTRPDVAQPVDLSSYRQELFFLNGAGLLQAGAALVVVVASGFQYQAMAEMLETQGFVFELRVVYLLLLSHLMLNVPLSQVLRRPELRSARWVLGAYVVSTVLMQQRSRLFEISAVVIFTQLMWAGDRVRPRYVLGAVGALLVPNLLVLGRIGMPEDFSALVDGLFSFEYAVIFNNLLSAAIDSQTSIATGFTFTPSLLLLIPSPIRSVVGLDVQKGDYYADLSALADLKNGGFSLLAEMYTNFGWFAPLVFGAFGLLLGWLISRCARVGHVRLRSAAAPLLYSAFILCFRNDFGVLLKYSLQLLLISGALSIAVRDRLGA